MNPFLMLLWIVSAAGALTFVAACAIGVRDVARRKHRD